MLLHCRLCADKLAKIKSPKISKKELSSKAITKRRKRIVKRVQEKLQEGLPIVLKDFRKIDELHDLRKQCKILRYTLEILPSKNDDKLAAEMEKWQTLLGDIRDIDVTEHFVDETGLSEDLEGALTTLKVSRDRMHRSFVHSAKTEAVIIPSN